MTSKRYTKQDVLKAAAKLQRAMQAYHQNDRQVVRAEMEYQRIRDEYRKQQESKAK